MGSSWKRQKQDSLNSIAFNSLVLIKTLPQICTWNDDSRGLIVQILLDAHRTPRIQLTLSEEDVRHFRIPSAVDDVRPVGIVHHSRLIEAAKQNDTQVTGT